MLLEGRKHGDIGQRGAGPTGALSLIPTPDSNAGVVSQKAFLLFSPPPPPVNLKVLVLQATWKLRGNVPTVVVCW